MVIPQKETERLNQFYNKVTGYAKKHYGYSSNKDTDTSRFRCIERNALTFTGNDYLVNGWFGFIRPEEPTGGTYSDLSIVFFPDITCKYCIISLGIGSEGLNNDKELALLPSTRRLFNRIRLPHNESFHFKTSFDDDLVRSPIVDYINNHNEYELLHSIVDKYENKLPASQIIILPDNLDDLDNDNNEVRQSIDAWLACYAQLRGWGSKPVQTKIEKAILKIENKKKELDQSDIWDILSHDKYIVLQGAPGTGKTYTANNIAQDHFSDENIIFEQFHAETTYSDFVYGIRPKLEGEEGEDNDIKYVKTEGALLRAIHLANNIVKSKTDEKERRVLLIIDEINRANLSNVLGPVFYLFEKHSTSRHHEILIGGESFKEIPSNLYVIATMNTADRSLAVVDFALRRRFTWITLRPHFLDNEILKEKKLFFHEEDFKVFKDIFFKYATDDELNLQPGHSYFITNLVENVEEQDKLMVRRLQYELLPLIKEYLNEGYIQSAKDQLENYFYERTGALLYE